MKSPVAGLLLALSAFPWAAMAQEAQPAPTHAVITVGPIEWDADSASGQAPALAIEEELEAKLSAVAGESCRVVPARLLVESARTLGEPVTVTDWSSATKAAEQLPYDLLILVRGEAVGEILSLRWQIRDCSGDDGTIAAGRIPGHMVDMDGFVTSLARRVGEASGLFEAQRLHRETRMSCTESDDAYRHYYIARALLRAEAIEEACQHLAAACEADPDLLRAELQLARGNGLLAAERQRAQRHEEALEFAEPALRVLWGTGYLDDLAPLLATIEASYQQLGQMARAREATVLLAEVLVSLGQGRLALAKLEQLAQAEYWDPRSPLIMAAALSDAGDWPAAQRVLEAARSENPNSIEALRSLGQLHLRWCDALEGQSSVATELTEHAKAALELLTAATKLDKHDPQLQLALGQAYLRREKWGDATKAVKTALAMPGARLGAEDEVSAHIALAKAALGRNRTEEAITSLNTATSLANGLPMAAQDWSGPEGFWYELPRAWLDAGDRSTAQRALLEVKLRFGLGPETVALDALLAPDSPDSAE